MPLPPSPARFPDGFEKAFQTLASQIGEMYQHWGQALAAISRLEGQQKEHERRIIRIEGMLAVQKNHRFNPSDSGLHYIVTNADGTERSIDSAAFDRAIRTHELEEDAGTWRGIRTASGKVMLAVVCAVAVALALALGGTLLVLVGQGRAPSVVTVPVK